MSTQDMYQDIRDGTYIDNFLVNPRDQAPSAGETRQSGLVEKRVQLLRALVARIEGSCDTTKNPALPHCSPPLFFSPRPLRPEEKRAPLLDAQWDLEDPKPCPPAFHFMPMRHRVVTFKQAKDASLVRKPQPPIGTGRPRPRAAATNGTSRQELFRLRPLPPCPQPPIGPTRDLLPLSYHAIGRRVFFPPAKEEDVSDQSDGDCLSIQGGQILLPLTRDDIDPRLSTIPQVKGYRDY
ncbi:hypothetical protein QCA50_005068 [Cerrena zonata]|uniref:Uncharacterized protein n=1 Tax=Cerrena zonata TaxID=2478898 RepID=A0AAW0GKJ3_9APHY